MAQHRALAALLVLAGLGFNAPAAAQVLDVDLAIPAFESRREVVPIASVPATKAAEFPEELALGQETNDQALIAEGLAYHPEIEDLPRFAELRKEIKLVEFPKL